MKHPKSSFKPRPNFQWPLITVTIVLFLASLSGFIFSHSSEIIKNYKEQLALVVELSTNAADEDVSMIKEFLKNHESVIASSVQFTSKEEGLKEMVADMGLEQVDEDLPNPLFDIIEFNCQAEAVNQTQIDAIKASLLDEYDEVVNVHYQDYLVNHLFGNLQSSIWIMASICAIILLLALLLIMSAIKLDLFDKRKIIRNMELIGASWTFIRKPFMRKGTSHAVLSSVLALLFSAASVYLIYLKIPSILSIMRWDYVAMIAITTVLSGLIIYWICIYTSVTKYLRQTY